MATQRLLILLGLLAALVGLSSCSSELLLEVELDLAPEQSLPDGYTSTDSINSFLQSVDMKWLRYFTNIVSGKQGDITMRTAHMMFKDAESWAQFEQEYLQRYNALFDHFWVNTRRVLWHVAPPEAVSFPKTARTEGVDAGYVYQVMYSVLPGKEQELKNEWGRMITPFIKDLERNPGFMERNAFISAGFQSDYDVMITYEFSSMKALAQSMYGQAFTTLSTRVNPFLEHFAVKIMAPGADEAYYWPAQGSDKAVEGQV